MTLTMLCVEHELSKTDDFANDSEACPEFDWSTDSHSLLRDIKYLMKEFYTATYTSQGNALKLHSATDKVLLFW